jgi:hypothetical protein
VQVAVIGPLHGEQEVTGRVRSWSIDPLPMVIFELLAAGTGFTEGWLLAGQMLAGP